MGYPVDTILSQHVCTKWCLVHYYTLQLSFEYNPLSSVEYQRILPFLVEFSELQVWREGVFSMYSSKNCMAW
jgi:hypothetical protein